MKKLVILIILLFPAIIGAAQSDDKLNIGGELYTNNRVRLNDTLPWSWNENRIDLQLTRKVSGFGKFNADVWFRSFNFSENDLINPYYTSNLTLPFSYEIREANFELYDFLIKNLDVTIGRQRIAWGTADKINPTDNLNPYDFADIFDFGRHLGSDAIDARYYIGDDMKIEGVFIPYFKPARLPFGDWWQAFEEDNSTLPDTMRITERHNIIQPVTINLKYNNFTYKYELPPNKFSDNPICGIKVAKTLFGFDFSASYVYGRDGFPLPSVSDVTVDSLSSTLDTAYLSIDTKLIYPREHIIGFDFAGVIGNFGVRGELGIFIPDKEYKLTINSPDPNSLVNVPIPLPLEFEAEGMPEDSVVFSSKAYAKYVLGLDYTFTWNAYLNFQYVHGFVNERGNGNMNDYFVLHFEKKFFDDKLILSPADVMAEVYDWNDIANNYAFVYMPTVGFQATDNAKIEIGARIIDGKGNGLFSKIKDKDEFVISAKYSF